MFINFKTQISNFFLEHKTFQRVQFKFGASVGLEDLLEGVEVLEDGGRVEDNIILHSGLIHYLDFLIPS